MKILFTSPGRRVELTKIFREVFPESKLYGGDYDPTSPANYFLDKVFKLPYKIDDKYVERIIEICRTAKIDIVIPLIDPELIYLAKYRESFFKNGIFLMVSRDKVIRTCADKWKTYQFLQKHKIPYPHTWLAKDFTYENSRVPLIFKPQKGSASKGLYVCQNFQDFQICKNFVKNKDYIVQEFIRGFEITVDIFATEEGKCIEAVQRRRLKVRGGEVERGVTQKDARVFEIVEKVVKFLKPFGVINLQIIYDPERDFYAVTEVNPRFGGGYPLSYKAGANFPLLIYKLFKGEEIKPNIGNYQKQIYMLRYDESIFTRKLVSLH